jgi:serine/threonine protein kinase
LREVSAPPDLRPGTIIAEEFRVLGLVGRGGMGAVYRVEHLATGRLRALKVLGPFTASQERARERFELEARIGARINSEHVVDVIAAGFEGPQQWPWIAMELLEGADLRALARRHGRVPRGMVREVLWQLVQGMASAHRAGVIHRDLKPENVFVARAERPDEPFMVKILDFGIAKLMHEGRAAASATSTVGTPLWIAPEQLKRGTLSVQTDVWALGLMVFWALTGRAYWEAANEDDVPIEALLTEILMAPLAPASERARALGVPDGVVPPGLDEWFERCVTREPQARYGGAAEAGRELDQVLRPLGVHTGKVAVEGLLFAGMAEPSPASMTLAGSGRGDETVIAPTLGGGTRDSSAPQQQQQLYFDRFFRVIRRTDGIVVAVRSDERSDDLAAFLRSASDVFALLNGQGETIRGVLLDFRLAPPRNDDQFEDAMAQYSFLMAMTPKRIAFLVSTVAGMLQLKRLGGQVAAKYPVFRDEQEALTFLREGTAAGGERGVRE